MLENGYIKLHRALFDWGWYKDVSTCKLWIHTLLRANIEESTYMGKTIPRGAFVTSLQSLASENGLSIQQVRTALRKLVSTGEITVETNRRFTIITVAKYGEYQQTNNKQSTDHQQTDNKPITNHQQTINKQVTTEKESKKARKQESKNITLSSPTVQKELARGRATTPELNFAEPVLSAVKDWLAYKAERKETYKPTGLKSLLTEITNRERKHGAQAVADVIRLSMANGWRGIIWDRIAAGKPEVPAADAPLSDWEREWMDEVKRRQKDANADT